MCEHTNPTLVDPPVEIVSPDEPSSTSVLEVITHEVRFGIPLQDQRRIWILENLLNEGVHSVLDIGCGEGDLMSCLCNPAPYLPDPPAPPTPSTSSPPRPSTPTHEAEPEPEAEKFIHIHTLQGLDISRECLEWTIRSTAPPPPSLPASPSPPPSIHLSSDLDLKASSQQNHLTEQGHTIFSPDGSRDLTRKRKRRKERDWSWRPRWAELEVKIWEGGLQTENEEFVGVECIVATEVIEHLPPSIFPAFAPVLLGKYHPPLLLMTTPNFSFNELFRPPQPPLPSIDMWGYADPTKRTTRRFRHDDHKFEWTPRECREWAVAVGEEWGYEVSVGGVGRANDRDPWGRDRCAYGDRDGEEDADKVWGTQVVRFRRIDGVGDGVVSDGEGGGKDWERKREERYERWKVCNKARTEVEPDMREHELLATHHYAKHSRAGKPSTSAEVAGIVREHMREAGMKEMTMHSLWMEEEVAEACGGWIEVLIYAVHESREVFEFRKGGDDDKRVNRRENVDRGRVVRREDWVVILLEDLPIRDEAGRRKADESEAETSDEDEDEDERQYGREYSGSDVAWGGEDSEETTGVGDASVDSVWEWGTSESGWGGEGGGWGDTKEWGNAEAWSSVDPLQDN